MLFAMGTTVFLVTGCASQKSSPLPPLITKKKAELQLGKVAGKGWYLPWYRLEKGNGKSKTKLCTRR